MSNKVSIDNCEHLEVWAFLPSDVRSCARCSRRCRCLRVRPSAADVPPHRTSAPVCLSRSATTRTESHTMQLSRPDPLTAAQSPEGPQLKRAGAARRRRAAHAARWLPVQGRRRRGADR
jgi:hypothetical protein